MASRKVVVGVGGGIAAYKACHVIRAFKESGDDVTVVPTPSAVNFVGKATFEALSGNPVSTTVFDAVNEVRHVRIGQEADLVVIVPATADLLARLAHGRANDLLTATVLVASCPVLVAPAMHTEMWLNPATQDNVWTLRGRGMTVMEPAHGRLTGKDSGPGRLPDPEQIVDLANAVASGAVVDRSLLMGFRVLVTAGGTREAIDPVRYIGNRSSGRQGFALAEIAAQKGAEVTVVAGVTDELPTPIGAKVVRVESTAMMYDAVHQLAGDIDLFILAAAVSDFRPVSPAREKLKKGNKADEAALSTISLVENPDILRSLVDARDKGIIHGRIVGFAAETGTSTRTPLQLAQEKIARKGCDMLMANDVSEGKVFGSRSNAGWLLSRNGTVREIGPGSKLKVASDIFAGIEDDLLNK